MEAPKNTDTPETTSTGTPVPAATNDTPSSPEAATTIAEVVTTEMPVTSTTTAVVSDDVQVAEAAPSSPVADAVAATPAAVPLATAPVKTVVTQYAIAAAVIIVMGMILWYGLERQGRVDTGFFDSVTALVSPEPAAATVNGKAVTMAEFERNKSQLLVSAGQQGIDTTNESIMAEINTQAIDTLINTELLRQGAAAAGVVVTPEQVEARYQEVLTTVGGAEVLAARMAEIGIDDAGLRRDIEGEILIQAYLAQAIDTTGIVVTDAEITGVYDQAKAATPELPALDDVRAEIESQLRFSKEQELVNAFIEKLRAEADIKVQI